MCRMTECYYCTAEAFTSCRECDEDLCNDCDVNTDGLDESICEPCLIDEEETRQWRKPSGTI